jgi:hypothetical protein
LDNLGLVQSSLGNLHDALKSARAAMEVRDRLLGKHHREAAKSRVNLAAVLLRLRSLLP